MTQEEALIEAVIGTIPIKSEFIQNHFTDDQGRPAGGTTFGQGFCISWQHGPLGQAGPQRKPPNGAYVEDIIAAVIGRLEFYQASPLACPENEQAINHLKLASEALQERISRRENAGIEGTHQGN